MIPATMATTSTQNTGTIRGTIIPWGTIRGTIISADRPPITRITMRRGTIIVAGDDVSGILSPRTGKKETNRARVTRIYRPHRPPDRLDRASPLNRPTRLNAWSLPDT
jgi:hypothetical protein